MTTPPTETARGHTHAVLYRMVMPDHICPYGLKSLDQLKRHGYAVEDRHLKTREETDDFKARHQVTTTPQAFIGGRRIGGYDDLRAFLGNPIKPNGATQYGPVVALFSMAAAMASALELADGVLISARTVERFIAIAMCLLALQKLRDVERFSTMFLNYDLLARRWVRYGYLYPYAEATAGVLMLAGMATWISAPLGIFIGTVGAMSVIKAVYIDRRELKCACVGGDSDVPLGFVSLTENLMMIAMSVWMAFKSLSMA